MPLVLLALYSYLLQFWNLLLFNVMVFVEAFSSKATEAVIGVAAVLPPSRIISVIWSVPPSAMEIWAVLALRVTVRWVPEALLTRRTVWPSAMVHTPPRVPASSFTVIANVPVPLMSAKTASSVA